MNLVKIISFFFFSISISASLYSQKTFVVKESIQWEQTEVNLIPSNLESTMVYSSDKTSFYYKHAQVPIYSTKVKLPQYGRITAKLEIISESSVNLSDPNSISAIAENIVIHTEVAKERESFYALISFIPFKKSLNGFSVLNDFTLKIEFEPESYNIFRGPGNVDISKLVNGDIYKIGVAQTGIIQLDYNFLKNELGIENLDNIDPKKIQILGQGGGVLPESSEIERTDDLHELPIYIQGENDGQFNSGDYILFYGEEADVWRTNNQSYEYQKNVYSELNYYFIKISNENGKRIQERGNLASAEYSHSNGEHIIRFEEDLNNLLGGFSSTQGTGQRWFGKNFNIDREQDFSQNFKVPNPILNELANLRVEFGGRSNSTSRFECLINNELFQKTLSGVSTGNIEARYASVGIIEEDIQLNDDSPSLVIRYPENGTSSEGWIDYIQLIARRENRMIGSQTFFQDSRSVSFSSSELNLLDFPSNNRIWDITNAVEPVECLSENQGNNTIIRYESSENIKRFIAFAPSNYLNATAIGKIENQNLHGIQDVQLIIVYHPNFKDAAESLRDHRSNHSGIDVLSIDVNAVYNEFASGRCDPSAIRDFAKMLYDRTPNFKSLLLLGDGSYDYKGIVPGLENQNFIPVYETKESLDPIGGFPTDDYFALLDDFEGDNLQGMLDIGVGRIPVRTSAEANSIVNKIIHYDTHPETLGEWRLNIGFTADDEDNNIHLNQADEIANKTENNFELFNQKKVYFDAYPQVTTPGGQRFPAANEALNNNIFKGMLVLNYLGHGGPKGWAQERVLQVDDVIGWDNFDKMALLVTATCSFTGYDDPAITSAGEASFLNPNGGAIGLMSTVRAVYSFENKRLTESVFDTIFTRENNEPLAIGEILRRAKNQNWQDTAKINARKFTLIGDPSMQLALPKYDIVTSHINEQVYNPASPDTIRALQKVKIEGFVSNTDGSIKTGFNGIVYPTVFDKKSNLETLGNDEKSYKRNFTAYKNIIFKGAATVTDGKFSFEFVVPKDINYVFGNGKISYYATDGVSIDAAGYSTNIIIGGTDPNAVSDNTGPEINLFMNDESFVYGGITDANPNLLVKLKDDLGINISGTSVGHDLSGELDNDSQQSFIMNDFYEADVDDFTSGQALYPLKDLSPGIHTIKVKAWDVSNNVSEAQIEFRVLEKGDENLEHVLNYPNPFTSNTSFQFEHDLPGSQLDILVHIYTLSGKLIKTIKSNQISNGYRIDNINWDGRDDFGAKIGKGIYLYKIKVKANELNQSRESNFEKLAILK